MVLQRAREEHRPRQRFALVADNQGEPGPTPAGIVTLDVFVIRETNTRADTQTQGRACAPGTARAGGRARRALAQLVP